VNALTSTNYADDSVGKAALASDIPRTGYGLIQHTDGSLYVDVSDTNPCIEITDGGIRTKVYGMINRTTNGLTFGRTGDVILSSNANTPDGWNDVSSTYGDKFIRISATALSAGGDDEHTHTGPSHTHAMSGNTGQSTLKNYTHMNGNTPNPDHPPAAHVHSIGSIATTAGGTSNTGVASDVPAYITLKAYQKA